MSNQTGKVNSVSGPLVVASGMRGTKMYEIVLIGEKKLVGETILVEDDQVSIQCFENTSGVRVGEKVERTGSPLVAELGPGLLGNIFDGIQRPLQKIEEVAASPFIPHGCAVPSLDRDARWVFEPVAWIAVGAMLQSGDVFGEVRENELFAHKLMVPPLLVPEAATLLEEHRREGGTLPCGFRVDWLAPAGEYGVDDEVCRVTFVRMTEPATAKKTFALTMIQRWPVRDARPFQKKLVPTESLVTGQRVLDVLFPAALGGTCCVPGAFGCGKTVISQAVSKFANCDVVVYVGCGERGNEMAEVLHDFAKIRLRAKGVSAMQRTVLIANTSNMPVAAREASVYTGVTVAEYFRDMGHQVVLLADSTSRWAEALREISGRLGEMPADSGYPAYLGARVAAFYERAGRVAVLQSGDGDRVGSVTLIGAVSPPGGDFSDPVTSATLANVQVFWGLDKKLAKRKHFPAVNWLLSYSKAIFSGEDAFDAEVALVKDVLQKEDELLEVVQLVGPDSLTDEQRAILATARLLKEDFLQQNSYSSYDAFCPLAKSRNMLRVIAAFHRTCLQVCAKGGSVGKQLVLFLEESKELLRQVADMKFAENIDFSRLETAVRENLNEFLLRHFVIK